MSNADDLHYTVAPDTIDNDVSGLANPLVLLHPVPSMPKRVGTHPGQLCNVLRAWQGRGRVQGGKHCPHQAVVATSGLDAPLTGAFEEDTINVIFGAAEKPVAQRP